MTIEVCKPKLERQPWTNCLTRLHRVTETVQDVIKFKFLIFISFYQQHYCPNYFNYFIFCVFKDYFNTLTPISEQDQNKEFGEYYLIHYQVL